MPNVRIYTTSYCGFCFAAKRLLNKRNIPFEEINVTGDGAARAELVQLAEGRTTVPQIFINGAAIGGYTDLAALDSSGQLSQLLAA